MLSNYRKGWNTDVVAGLSGLVKGFVELLKVEFLPSTSGLTLAVLGHVTFSIGFYVN